MSKRANALALAIIIVMVSAGAAQGLSGKNKVFSNDLAEGAVHSSDIKNGTIRGKDVKNNSLTAKDIDESTLDIGLMRGSTGLNQGPAGPGSTVEFQAVAASKTIPANLGDGMFVDCPAGWTVISGGFAGLESSTKILESEGGSSIASPGAPRIYHWHLVFETGNAEDEVFGSAICARVQ